MAYVHNFISPGRVIKWLDNKHNCQSTCIQIRRFSLCCSCSMHSL